MFVPSQFDASVKARVHVPHRNDYIAKEINIRAYEPEAKRNLGGTGCRLEGWAGGNGSRLHFP